ncbi:MAG: hypothetical protein NC222_06220 [Staphylococcus sp.]|nr:hypothetical protein [Staphylococcus sp.]
MSQVFIRPGASRYRLSPNFEWFSVNSEGKRIKFGGCQNLNLTQTKNTTRSFELNTDPECIEVTQGLVTDISLSVQRICLNESTLIGQFSGMDGIESLYDQSLYFDIEQVVYIPKINADGSVDPRKENGTRKILRVFKDCVFSNYSDTNTIQGDIRIIENGTIQVRKIVTPQMENMDY